MVIPYQLLEGKILGVTNLVTNWVSEEIAIFNDLRLQNFFVL